eukprot:14648097-Ditylum_brightwellii.AAC.1
MDYSSRCVELFTGACASGFDPVHHLRCCPGEGKKLLQESECCLQQTVCNTTHTGRVELIMVPGLNRSGDRTQVQGV